MKKKTANVLLLGKNRELAAWLESQGCLVLLTDQPLTPQELKWKPDIIVSHGYRHLLTKKYLNAPPLGCINLHISLLPWNRGASPNLWSIVEGTPSGVTIHEMDEGIDTGGILFQKPVRLHDTMTLASSYDLLQKTVIKLFKKNWQLILSGGPKNFISNWDWTGNFHSVAQSTFISNVAFLYDYNITIREFRKVMKVRGNK